MSDDPSKLTGFTGFHDSHGIPICVGDLIRVSHYRHYRGRRQMWMYFRVAEHPQYEKSRGVGLLSAKLAESNRYVIQNWHDLDASKWQCLLRTVVVDVTEVMDESVTQRHEDGSLMTFNERPRLAQKGGDV